MKTAPPDMKVRLSADLRQKVEAAARQNNRTLNSEIVFRLEASFWENDERSALAKQRISSWPLRDVPDPIYERLTALERRVEELEGKKDVGGQH